MSQSASAEYAKVERLLHDQVSRETRRQGLIGNAAVAVGRALLIGSILGAWSVLILTHHTASTYQNTN